MSQSEKVGLLVNLLSLAGGPSILTYSEAEQSRVLRVELKSFIPNIVFGTDFLFSVLKTTTSLTVSEQTCMKFHFH